jgi:hypothetical protein
MDSTMENLPYASYHIKLWILIFVITTQSETAKAKARA